LKTENKRQAGCDFYDFQKYVCLGIIFVTKNQNNQIVLTKFTCVSEFLKQGVFSVCVAFKKIFESQEYKDLNVKKLSIWSDRGKHFHSYSFLGFFYELVQQKNLKDTNAITILERLAYKKSMNSAIFGIEHNISTIMINFFVEYHGKFIVDSHFSYVSYLMRLIKDKDIDITDVSKLAQALREMIVHSQDKEDGFESFNFQNEKKIIHKVLEIEEKDYLEFSEEKQKEFVQEINNHLREFDPNYEESNEEIIENSSENRSGNAPANNNSNRSNSQNNNNITPSTNRQILSQNRNLVPPTIRNNNIPDRNTNQHQNNFDIIPSDNRVENNTFGISMEQISSLPLYDYNSQQVIGDINFQIQEHSDYPVNRITPVRRNNNNGSSEYVPDSSTSEQSRINPISANPEDSELNNSLIDEDDDDGDEDGEGVVNRDDEGDNDDDEDEGDRENRQINVENDGERVLSLSLPFLKFSSSNLKYYSSFSITNEEDFQIDLKVSGKKDFSAHQQYQKLKHQLRHNNSEELLWKRKTHKKDNTKLNSPLSFRNIYKKMIFSQSPEKNPNKVLFPDISIDVLSQNIFPKKATNIFTTKNSILMNQLLIERARNLGLFKFFFFFFFL
jgi:hypothetical protein